MHVIGIAAKARHGKDFSAQIIRDIAESEFGVRTAIWSMAHALKARVYGEAKGDLSFEDVWVKKPPILRKLLQETGTERGRLVFGEGFWLLQAEAIIRLLGEHAGVGLVIIPDIRFPNEVEFAQLGAREPMAFRERLMKQGREAAGLTLEEEESLLENNPAELLVRETEAVEIFNTLYYHEVSKQPGLCLRIRSDRPTLKGEASRHPSETSLDGMEDNEFDGVINNDLDMTAEGLRDQLRPIVSSLLSE